VIHTLALNEWTVCLKCGYVGIFWSVWLQSFLCLTLGGEKFEEVGTQFNPDGSRCIAVADNK